MAAESRVPNSKLDFFATQTRKQLKAQVDRLDSRIDGVGDVEVLTAAKTLTANDSGKTFFLNSATEFAVTLPAPELGLKFKFFVKAAPSGASYTVVTAGAAQNLGGKVVAAGATAGDVENAATATTITFVAGSSVYGDYAEVVSDGDGWYALGVASVAAGITITG